MQLSSLTPGSIDHLAWLTGVEISLEAKAGSNSRPSTSSEGLPELDCELNFLTAQLHGYELIEDLATGRNLVLYHELFVPRHIPG